MKIRHFISIVFFAVMTAVTVSCSTGIERTARITPTREDRRVLRRQPEEILLDSVRVAPLASWRRGRRFMLTDSRASLIYEVTDTAGVRTHAGTQAGTVITYEGTGSRRMPDGAETGVVDFSDAAGRTLRYVTRKDPAALDSMTWGELPMAVDLEEVDALRELLCGRKVWTRLALWQDDNGDNMRGAQFVPVTVTDVVAGDAAFPVRIGFDYAGSHAWMPMNMPDRSMSRGSRTFAQLFSLSDPRLLHPDILPEVWDLICRGRVREGMTKEECKLALGNPREVEHGHNWDTLVDYWKYDDGTFLLFVDDRLTKERK